MSKYTTEVRYICEEAAGLSDSTGFNDIESVITEAAPNVFNFNFPVFDEQYRLPLEKTILRHFYTREISDETVGLWKLRLWDKLNLIMPYYNKLYLSETLEFNPLYDVDYTRTSTTELDGSSTQNDTESTNRTANSEIESTGTSANTETRNLTDKQTGTDTTTNDTTVTDTKNLTDQTTGTSTVTNTGTVLEERDLEDTHSGTNSKTGSNTQRNLFSDTPQGALTGVENEKYLTDARKITDASTESGTDGSTDNHTGTVKTTNNLTQTTNNTDTVTQTGTDTVVTDGEQVRTANLTDLHTGTVGNSGNTSDNTTTEETETGSRTLQGRGTVNNVTEFVEHVVGKQGSGSFVQMIKEYRDALLNIDMMVLNELSDLFIALW